MAQRMRLKWGAFLASTFLIVNFQNCSEFTALNSQFDLASSSKLASKTWSPQAPIPTVEILGSAEDIWLAGGVDPIFGKTPHAEITPFVIAGAWTSLLIPSNFSFLCSFPPAANPLLLSKNVTFDFQGANSWCQTLLSPSVSSENSNQNVYSSPSQWRRNYAGSFAGLIQNGQFLTFNHGENKNEIVGGTFDEETGRLNNATFVQNSINGNVGPECASGYEYPSKKYQDCFVSYSAFIYIDSYFWDATNGYGSKLKREIGPVIWPSRGYLYAAADGKLRQASQGARHPSLFIEGDYAYIFFQDTMPPDAQDQAIFNSQPGFQMGIKLARVPLSQIDNPTAYRNWFQGVFNEASAPASLDISTTEGFRRVLVGKGGRSDLIFDVPGNQNVVRASVAKIKGSDWYMALLQGSDWTTKKPFVSVSFSKSLTSWSSPTMLFEGNSYGEFGMLYALPMSKDGTSNMLVDPSEGFYIVGVSAGGVIYRQSVKLK